MKLILAIWLGALAFSGQAYGRIHCFRWLEEKALASPTAPGAVIVVDPFSFRAGEQYPERLRLRGKTPILVISSENAPEYYASRLRQQNVEVIVHRGKLSETVEAISLKAKSLGLSVQGVVSGTDGGVLLMDKLADAYRVPSNGMNFSDARRDKVLMQWRLRDKGLRYIPSRYAKSVGDVQEFVKNDLPEFPERRVVLKPISSACTDRVYLLNDLKKVPAALEDIFSKPTVYGEPIDRAICQAEVMGTEYIFDTVSVTVMIDGKPQTFHQAVGAWIYHRQPSGTPDMAPVINHVEWVPFEKLPPLLVEYAWKVLEALEVHTGPAHLEIMMTSDGPILVEIGSRLPGGLPAIAAEAAGAEFHQTELALDAIFNPQKLVELIRRTKGAYPTRQHADIVFLSIKGEGHRLNPEAEAMLNRDAFPTLSDYRIFAAKDSVLAPTTNVTNALMRVHFAGSRDKVDADGQALRRRHEKREFYLKP